MPFPRDRHPLRDRVPNILEVEDPAVPLPPLNIQVSSSFQKGSFDIRWSNPSELQVNTKFNILGVNIYRSFDSEFGPYFRLTPVPIGSNFYRDQTEVTVALQEDVSNSFTGRGPETHPDGRYVFRTKHRPLFLQTFPGIEDCLALNVFVTVNGEPSLTSRIVSDTGEIELWRTPRFDVINQTRILPNLPEKDTDVVLATYKYIKNIIKTDLDPRIYYRITTVVQVNGNRLIETPLERAAQSNNQEVERINWIWREAVRRNSWILDQGGERVKIFIRRLSGNQCGCTSDEFKQPSSDCLACFGTGILGGYEGPYDLTIAPDDGEKNIAQSNRGRTKEHTYDSWTGPNPLLSQRDFIVKLNGDRYGIGAVRMPSNRGAQLQQFFTISHLDEQDIRYQVPVLDTAMLMSPETRYMIPGRGEANPIMTERDTIPDEREERGFSVTYENHKRR